MRRFGSGQEDLLPPRPESDGRRPPRCPPVARGLSLVFLVLLWFMLSLVRIQQQSAHLCSQGSESRSLISPKRSERKMLIMGNTVQIKNTPRCVCVCESCTWAVGGCHSVRADTSPKNWRTRRRLLVWARTTHHPDLNYRWRHLIGRPLLRACVVLHPSAGDCGGETEMVSLLLFSEC